MQVALYDMQNRHFPQIVQLSVLAPAQFTCSFPKQIVLKKPV